MSAIALRSDINGLRGLAVLSVVGFHAFPEVFPGGFLGVDVFFVISGFLITSIILTQLSSGTFSFVEFFSNRIKRIFPALLLVLVSCFLTGSFLLTREEFKELNREALGGAMFVANFVFASDVGYFDASADTKPLLHLWSLGVEEQFYLLWPVMVVFFIKVRKSILLGTAVICTISFAMNLHTSLSDPSLAFYLPHTRIWELLIGAVLAEVLLKNESIRHTARHHRGSFSELDVYSVFGFALILTSIFLVPRDLVQSGARAIAPTLGAALIIAGGAQSWLNRKLLGGDALVQVGLISYCLYLWHWPLLYFLRLIWGAEVPLGYRIAVVMVSVFVAGATYALLERPLRRAGNTTPKVVVLIAAMAALVCTSLMGYKTDSIPLQLANISSARIEGDIGHIPFFKYMDKHFFPCTPTDIYENATDYDGYSRCKQSRSDSLPSIALLGDSHAEHIFIGLAEAMPDVNLVYYTNTGAPYFGRHAHQRALEHIIGTKNLTTVIVAAYWANQADPIQLKQLLNALSTAGKKIYLLDDVPDFSFQPSECKFSRWIGSSLRCEDSVRRFESQSTTYLPILESSAKAVPGLRFLTVGRSFCDETECRMTRNNQILYRDPNHLNVLGSQFLGQMIVERAPELKQHASP
ncbi:acyltransferase family protein [Polaromonas sp.]|uniref:acyltransferase family protein n=1 Tax=Polaromonas sp. TaxID=1869339 RepID=UPI003266A46F